MSGAAAAATAAAAAAVRAAAARATVFSSSSSSSKVPFRCFSGFVSSGLQQRHLLQPQQLQQQQLQQQQQRQFSSSKAAAESLSSTIQKEIAHEKGSFEPDKQLQAFLEKAQWQLEDKENDMLVVLSKEVDGKKVTVEFSCIQPSGGDEEETIPDASDFTVSIQNASGNGLLFYCSTTSEDDNARFCIGQVRYYHDQAGKDSLASYPGPYFEDLDDAFQEGLDAWLASLGINGDLCDFIDRFAAEKENKEYIQWLTKLQAFVSKP
ncbi:hypothetical protein Emed_002162 [Eimeria media]